MTELPAPLVPPEVDLRDLDGFMLNVERLLASELWALTRTVPEAFRPAHALWCRAWKQIPAASLPDDENILAAFAETTPRQFRKLRHLIMRGFVLCSDGRWYHKTLASDALRAWDKRLEYQEDRDADRERLKRWREAKRRKRETGGETPNETTSETPSETRVTEAPDTPSETPLKRLRQGQGQEQEESKKEDGGGPREGLAEGKGSAQQVVDHFLAERNRLWPSTSRLPGPTITIRTEAQQLLDRGAPVDLLRELITRGMERTAADGKSPPSTLRAYQDSLADAVTAYLKPMPDGDPLAVPPFLRRPANGMTTNHLRHMSIAQRVELRQAEEARTGKRMTPAAYRQFLIDQGVNPDD